jgi:hypothetical protein
MSVLSGPQQTELEKPVTRTAYFVELQFVSGTSRLCTADRTLTWGGHDWAGLGQIMSMSSVEESEGAAPRAITLKLSVAQLEWMAIAVGPVEEYRGQPIRLYMCPMNAAYVLIGTPALAWRGLMDTLVLGISEQGQGGLTLQCETSAYALKRRPALRVNAAQHKARFPADTGFDYLNDLLANPQLWLSKKFQAR